MVLCVEGKSFCGENKIVRFNLISAAMTRTFEFWKLISSFSLLG